MMNREMYIILNLADKRVMLLFQFKSAKCPTSPGKVEQSTFVESVCLMLLALNEIFSDNEFDFRSLRDVTVFINNKNASRNRREAF